MDTQITYPTRYLKHADKIYGWLKTGTTFPITIELDPSTVCGHKCPRCVGQTKNIPKQIITSLDIVTKKNP